MPTQLPSRISIYLGVISSILSYFGGIPCVNGESGTLGYLSKITASDGTKDNYYGGAVATSGNYMIVGSSGEETVYIYQYDDINTHAWMEHTSISNPNPSINDHFGNAVSICDNGNGMIYAIIGASYDDMKETDQGSAFIYEFDSNNADYNTDNNNNINEWNLAATLVKPNPTPYDYFGNSVSISGNYAIVGNARSDNELGSAFIYERDSNTGKWHQIKQLFGSGNGDSFGISVSISGINAYNNDVYAVVGAHKDDQKGFHAGCAYVYLLAEDSDDSSGSGDEWSKMAKLTANDGGKYDYLGYSVDIAYGADNIHVIVGAYGGGAGYIFERDNGGNWHQISKLLPNKGISNDHCGFAVSVASNVAVVGCFGSDNSGGTDAGSVYIFRKAGALSKWYLSTDEVLYAPDGRDYNQFGFAVSVSDEFAVIGSSYNGNNDEYIGNEGSIYTYAVDGDHIGRFELDMRLNNKLIASNVGSSDIFGHKVATSGKYAIVGAFGHRGGDEHNLYRAGGAYIYEYDSINDKWIERVQLTHPSPEREDYYGWSVGITTDPSGDDGYAYAIVGCVYDDITESRQGSAFIYERDSVNKNIWNLVATLTHPSAAASDEMGFASDINGDYAIVGVKFDDEFGSNAGSALIYKRDSELNDGTWNLVQHIRASDASSDDYFGFAVAITDGGTHGDSGVYAIAGAYADWDGTAYVYERDVNSGLFNEVGILKPEDVSDREYNDYFGYSVDISINDNTGEVNAIIGTLGDDALGASNHGAAYIFARDMDGDNEWYQVIKFMPEERETNDNCGRAVSINLNNDIALVGCRYDDVAGSVYVYKKDTSSTWKLANKVNCPDADSGAGNGNDFFGSAVAISNYFAIVGADGENNKQGAAYIYSLFDSDGLTSSSLESLDQSFESEIETESLFSMFYSYVPDYGIYNYVLCGIVGVVIGVVIILYVMNNYNKKHGYHSIGSLGNNDECNNYKSINNIA